MPIGFTVLHLAAGIPAAAMVSGSGIAGVIGAGKVGSTAPPAPSLEHAILRGPEFERGMREGYAEQLRARRMKAAVGGAGTGVVVGLGLLLSLLAQLD